MATDIAKYKIPLAVASVVAFLLMIMIVKPILVKKRDFPDGTPVVSVGDESIGYPLAAGYCILSPENKGHAAILNAIELGNKDQEILLGYAECQELRDWEVGDRDTINHFGYVSTPQALTEVKFVGSAEQYASAFGEDLPQATEVSLTEIKTIGRTLRPGDSHLLGVVHRDENAAYVASIQGAIDTSSNSMLRMNMFLTAVVNGKKVNQYLNMPFSGQQTIDYMRVALKANAEAIQNTNTTTF